MLRKERFQSAVPVFHWKFTDIPGTQYSFSVAVHTNLNACKTWFFIAQTGSVGETRQFEFL